MKVYTDYGNTNVKALESCIIEIEGVREWAFISQLFKDELEHNKGALAQNWPDYDYSFEKENIQILGGAIKALEWKNTIDLKKFSLKKIKKGLHKVALL